MPEKVNECSKDMPVVISDLIVYLTKEGILRRSSDIKSCSSDYEFFRIEYLEIVRQNNLMTTIEKDERKISFFDSRSKIELFKVKKYVKDFLEFYRKYFGTNENFLIFRDCSFLILLLITIIMILIKS